MRSAAKGGERAAKHKELVDSRIWILRSRCVLLEFYQASKYIRIYVYADISSSVTLLHEVDVPCTKIRLNKRINARLIVLQGSQRTGNLREI